MLSHFQPKAEHGVCEHAVVGHELVEIGIEIERLVDRRLARDEAVAPFVAERCGGDHAELAVFKDVERRAGRDAAGEIDRQVALLEQDEVRIVELAKDALQVDIVVADTRTAVEEALQRVVIGNLAATVIETGPVVVAAIICVARTEGRLAIAADRSGHGDEAFGRDGAGGQIDHAAAEFAGEVRGIGLLDQARCDNAGREDVERHHAAERLRGGQGEAVEQGERIAIAKAADIDETVALGRQAGHAAERTRDIALARAGDAFCIEDGDDLAGRAGHVALAATSDDDRTARNRNVGLGLFFDVGNVARNGIVCVVDIVGQLLVRHLCFCRWRAFGAGTLRQSGCREGEGG